VIRIAILALTGAWMPLALLTGQNTPTARFSGQAILIYTTVDPIPGGRTLGEVRVVQPVLMLDAAAFRRRLLLHASADFEGWTIPNGELAPGAWGEGYTDRRHPHTYVHELVLSFPDLLGRLDGAARTTVTAGKGFVPFGTDDPMSRPVERYPVNHHLSQLLERALAMVAVDAGPATLEAAAFNGDEPTSPGDMPYLSRFGDSWAARLTLRPVSGFEWQASTAAVHSPENRPGAGTDARKWSTSVRVDRRFGSATLYSLGEWARTSEAQGAFVFHSLLFEAAVTTGRHQPYYRFERTERPEESRLLNEFRTVRPLLDNSILGITRWSIHTMGYAVRLGASTRRLALEPFVEVSLGRIATVAGGLFNVTAVYGRDSFRSLSAGLRLDWGMRGHRMGHYGVPMEMPEMPPMKMSGRAH
jgi:hypothetical protein